jgi:hypothetical protein
MLIQSKALDRWNGILPQFSGGGAIPLINMERGFKRNDSQGQAKE